MIKAFLILFALLSPSLAYPATDWLPVVDQGNVSLSYPGGNASERFTVTLEKAPGGPGSGYKTMGSVRYGYGNYTPIKVLAGQGHMIAYVMQNM
jgi:hypothetical protein